MALDDPQLCNDTHILSIFRHYAFLSTLVCKNAFLLFVLLQKGSGTKAKRFKNAHGLGSFLRKIEQTFGCIEVLLESPLFG